MHGSAGNLSYFVSGSQLKDDIGVENPISTRYAIDDQTRQYGTFSYLSDILSDRSRLTVFGGTAIGHFQVPDNPAQVPHITLNLSFATVRASA